MTIQEYIEDFRSTHDNAVYEYTHGKCMTFALLLENKFGGELIYLPLQAHFVLYLNGKMWDITGNVSKVYAKEKRVKLEDVKIPIQEFNYMR